MASEASWTEKFDRWWAESYPDVRALIAGGDEIDVRNFVGSAFMAGAAAERAEHRLPKADWIVKPDAATMRRLLP